MNDQPRPTLANGHRIATRNPPLPTPAANVPFPFVLPPAALDIADRITAKLMTLVDAVGIILTDRSVLTSFDHPAQALFFRLATIVTTLIRLSLDGPRPRAAPKPSQTDRDPAHRARRSPSDSPSPRRPLGWILDVLPEIAPAVASDLAALLADPAFATLLDAAPILHRRLGPILRGLGLAPLPTPSAPPPEPPPPDVTLPESPAPLVRNARSSATRPAHLRAVGRPKLTLAASTALHAKLVTVS